MKNIKCLDRNFFYQEYIVKNKSLNFLRKEWFCKEKTLLKYLKIYNFEEKYSCLSCGSSENLVLKNSIYGFKYKNFCSICIRKKGSDAITKHNKNISQSIPITEDDLLKLHNDDLLSFFEIAKLFNVSTDRIRKLGLLHNIKEVVRCKYCKSEKDLSVWKNKKINICVSCKIKLCCSINNYSKVSQRLFWDVYNNLPIELQKNCHFATLNKEYYHKIPQYARESLNIKNISYNFDFLLNYNNTNLIIEFNGDVFHANPTMFYPDDKPNPKNKDIIAFDIWENDSKREDYIFSQGDMFITVWEKDYNSYRDDVISNILHTINMVYYNNENKKLRRIIK